MKALMKAKRMFRAVGTDYYVARAGDALEKGDR
jgi:hypothetical protein